ncbi:MAG: hypothetical protein ACO4AJ_09650 [Prochlorothrix sp.]
MPVWNPWPWSRLRPSPYHRCPTCDYWLTSQEVYCPNCNSVTQPARAFLPLKTLLFGSSVLGIHLAIGWAGTVGQDGEIIWVGRQVGQAVLGGLGVGAGVFFGTQRVLKQGLQLEITPPKPRTFLQSDEAKIQQRLQDLEERAEPILRVQERAKKIGSPSQRSTIEATLNHAMAVLLSHRDRYRTKLWEIQLIRWHNALKPLLDRWYSRLRDDSELLYRNLDTVRDRGEALLLEWEHTDLAATLEGAKQIDRLRAALASCDRMYQDLIAQQAAEAVQGISRFEGEPQFSYDTQVVGEQLDVFEALPNVVEFESGLETLEDEYRRLISEQTLSEQTLGEPTLGEQTLGHLD